MTPKMATQIGAFCEGAQVIVDKEYGAPGPRIYAMPGGRRFIRIVISFDPQLTAFAFIDITNGDVLMAAGWKGPAKHARGNLNDPDKGLRHVGPHGIAYLR